MTAKKSKPEKKFDFTPYLKQGLAACVLLIGGGGGHMVAMNSATDGMREDRHKEFQAHHVADSLRDEYMMRQNDTIIQLLEKHSHLH